MNPQRWVDDGLDAARALIGHGDGWIETVLHGTGGGAFGSVVVRFESGERSAVVKLVRRNDAAPSEAASWRREYDVYRSDWLRARLPSGLRMPDCLGLALTDGAAVIVLADIAFDERDRRSPGWYGELARELGRLNGASVPADDVPAWLTRRFVADEVITTAAAIPALLADDPGELAPVFDPWRRSLERFAATPSQLIAAVEQIPRAMHHLDAFSRNAARADDAFVLIDWAYAGLAPIGADAASTIAITAMHGDVPEGDLPALHDAVVTGFGAGLHDAGPTMSPDAIEARVALLLTIRVARFFTQLHLLDDLPTVAEQVAGRPYADVLTAWEQLAQHSLPYAERALSVAGA